MGSVFTTIPGKNMKGAFGKQLNIPFYIQFVPGYVVDVVHSAQSLRYNGIQTINTIIALPHVTDKVLKRRKTVGEENRYYPLFRATTDIPSKGDPVLLCTIGKINYYLGPLNTTNNNPTWNTDPNLVTEVEYSEFFRGEYDEREVAGESSAFNKDRYYKRLQKGRKDKLDFGDMPFETIGDYVIEGRHGNSLRIGSRSNNPYVFISNGRNPDNIVESIGDGTLISITSNGSLRQHFSPTYKLRDNQPGEDNRAKAKQFTLSSDVIKYEKNPPNRFMGKLITDIPEYSENNLSADDIIYNYNYNQILVNSERITLNSKLEDIYLSSFQDIHIGTGRHMTISTNNSLIIESENTFLGNPTPNGNSRSMESMVFGEKLQDVLNGILSLFTKFKILTQYGEQSISSSPTHAVQVQPLIDDLDKKIKLITSNKHFIEPN